MTTAFYCNFDSAGCYLKILLLGKFRDPRVTKDPKDPTPNREKLRVSKDLKDPRDPKPLIKIIDSFCYRDPRGVTITTLRVTYRCKTRRLNIKGEEFSSPLIFNSTSYPINNYIVEPRLRSLHV